VHDCVNCGVEVRVLEDDQRVLAAELQLGTHQSTGAGTVDGLPNRQRTCERDTRHPRIGNQRLTSLPVTLNQVEDARGDTGVGERLHQQRGSERRERRRFEHGAAPRQ
jgi:hypothetical protein